MPDPTGTLVAELRNAAAWDFDSDGTLLTRAADEIERLRGGWAPTIDEQVRIVRSWGWQRVANYHDARPGRDGPDVKACSHLDTDWCSQRDKGRMIPVFRSPIGATDA